MFKLNWDLVSIVNCQYINNNSYKVQNIVVHSQNNLTEPLQLALRMKHPIVNKLSTFMTFHQ